MAIISIPTAVGGVALPGALGQVASGPLAALFGGQGLNKLQYPPELATDATKTHYVEFAIKEVAPASYETSPSGANLTLGGTANGINAAISTDIGQNVVGSISNITGINKDKINGVIGGFSKALQEGISITPPVKKLQSLIYLYMPDTLAASYNATYSDVDLRDALGEAVNTLRSIDQLANPAVDILSGAGSLSVKAKQAQGVASTDPNAIGLAVKLGTAISGAKFGTGGDLGSVLLQGQGLAINPQVQMVYKGLPLRSFQLSFTFTPKSQQEAKTIDEIVYTFKKWAAPSLTNGAAASSQSMYLIPPALFQVQFKIKGAENFYLPKYADCVLENIDVNYAPNGFAAHTDGAPVQTTLNLQFKELEIVDRSRLQKGFQNNDAQGLR